MKQLLIFISHLLPFSFGSSRDWDQRIMRSALLPEAIQVSPGAIQAQIQPRGSVNGLLGIPVFFVP